MKKLLVLFAILVVTGCVVNPEEPFYEYTVFEGKQDFQPNDTDLIPGSPKKVTWVVTFYPSCYYNWLPDNDHYDMNKGGGWTEAWTANNKNTIMWAWRPAADTTLMEYVAYYNNPNGGFQFLTEVFRVGLDEEFWVTIEPINGTWVFSSTHIEPFDTEIEVSNSVRLVGLWIGGANNAEGPYGGKASQDMTLRMQRTIYD